MAHPSPHPASTTLPAPDLLTSVARSWRLVLGVTLVATAVGAIISLHTPPRFQATGGLTLLEPGESTVFRSANSRDAERRLLLQTEALRSDAVLSRAAAVLGPEWAPEDLREQVLAQPDGIRNRISVTGRAGSATAAAGIVNAVLASYEAHASAENQAAADAAGTRLATDGQQLEAVVMEAQEELDTMLAAMETQLAGLSAGERVRSAAAQLAADPEAEELRRRRDDALAELAMLRQESRKIAIDAALHGSGVKAVQWAKVPSRPYAPVPRRDAGLAGVAGLLLAAAVGAVRAERRPAAVSGAQAARHLGLTILAELPRRSPRRPRLARRRRGPGPHELDRTALTALQFALHRADGRSALLTSPADGDGKTLTALRLAAAGARDGRRVVLVDGDIRAAELTRAVGLGDRQGWPDAASLTEDAVHAVAAPGGSFAVVPNGGTSEAAPGASAAAFRLVIRALEADAEVVLVDGPPLTVADTALFARHVTGLVLVLGPRVEPETMDLLASRLAMIATPVLGCVIDDGRHPPTPRGPRRLRRAEDRVPRTVPIETGAEGETPTPAGVFASRGQLSHAGSRTGMETPESVS